MRRRRIGCHENLNIYFSNILLTQTNRFDICLDEEYFVIIIIVVWSNRAIFMSDWSRFFFISLVSYTCILLYEYNNQYLKNDQ